MFSETEDDQLRDRIAKLFGITHAETLRVMASLSPQTPAETAPSGPDEATPEEGVRLIHAFRQINDGQRRRALVAFAEMLADCDQKA